MYKTLYVYVDQGQPQLAGRLYLQGPGSGAVFTYEPTWLGRGYSLGPTLPLAPGPFHTTRGAVLPGILSDTCPDRWGRMVMRREEAHSARREKRTARTLTDPDCLVRVSDTLRLGAIRVSETEGGPYLAASGSIPLAVDLGRLLTATRKVMQDLDEDDDMKLLLAPGASLGGARPKAVVSDQGTLYVAKFPQPDDDWSIVTWEAVALRLAEKAGIDVAQDHRIIQVLNEPVLVTRRFDRDGERRRLYASAMTLLGAKDGDAHSYLDIAYVIRQVGDVEDLPRLWRRLVFNILISNTDDHLRNHAFLRGAAGWELSPAFDLNPVPPDVRPRNLTLAIDEADNTASLELALSVAEQFGLDAEEARGMAAEVGAATQTWRIEAQRQGIRRDEIERLSTAFEHDDLKQALHGSNKFPALSPYPQP